jgi:hypothetical protein
VTTQNYNQPSQFPIVPGHSTPEEILALLANPYGKADIQMMALTTAPAFLTPIEGRMSIVLSNQTAENLWLNFNDDAVPDECLFFPAWGIAGFDVDETVQISLRAAANPVTICVIQFGPNANFSKL